MSRTALELEIYRAEFRKDGAESGAERVTLTMTMDGSSILVEAQVTGASEGDEIIKPFLERHDEKGGWDRARDVMVELMLAEFTIVQYDLPIQRALGRIRLLPPDVRQVATEYGCVLASFGPPWMIQEVTMGDLVHIARKDGGLHIYGSEGQEIAAPQVDVLRAFFLDRDDLDHLGNFTLGAVLPKDGNPVVHDIIFWEPAHDLVADAFNDGEVAPGSLKGLALRDRGKILRRFRAAIGDDAEEFLLICPPMPVGAGRDAIERIRECKGNGRIFLRNGDGVIGGAPGLETTIFLMRNDHP